MTRSALAVLAFAAALAGVSSVRADDANADDAGPWGVLARMAGHDYWRAGPGLKPHASTLHVAWITPGKALGVTVKTQAEVVSVGEFRLDPATGGLIYGELQGEQRTFGTAASNGPRLVAYAFARGVPLRSTWTALPGGVVREDVERYVAGAWQSAGAMTFTPE